MRIEESFFARGHPNVRSSHKTTIMVTTEEFLTSRGDCIVALKSEKGLDGLCDEIKRAAQNTEAIITFSLRVEDCLFTVSGRGDKKITMMHPTDIVVRKSEFVCDRTLMVKADKAACDVSSTLIQLLKKAEQRILVTISVEL
jgi:hypothetical protein